MNELLSIVLACAKKSGEDFNHLLFKMLNLNKHSGHAANRICLNNTEEIFAVKCNCKKGMYHPVSNNKVYWEEEIPSKNIPGLKKLDLKTVLWVLQD